MVIKILVENEKVRPIFGSEKASGADVFVNSVKKLFKGHKESEKDLIEKLNIQLEKFGHFQLRPFETVLIGTGITLANIEEGYEIQLRPRSSVSLKRNLSVSFGTIDNDYRGEIGVILSNNNPHLAKVFLHEKIAQMVVSKIDHNIKYEVVSEIENNTERSNKGFGSTGQF